MLKDFKAFINRGNVVDLAVAVVIGAAFGTVIKSFVSDLITPIIGLFGKSNFDNMFLVIKSPEVIMTTPSTPAEAAKAGFVTLNYGAFLTNLLNFVIIAFAIFLIVKAYDKLKKEEAAAPAAPSSEVVLLTEIRDSLKKS